MTVQRLRPGIKTDQYSGLPIGEDWSNPAVSDLPGYAVGWQASAESPTVNRDELASQARPGGVPQIDVLTTDRIRAKGHDWDVTSHAMTEEYVDLLGVGLIDGPDAGTVWNLTLREG